MNIYLLMAVWPYEGSEVVSAHTTEAGALAALEQEVAEYGEEDRSTFEVRQMRLED